MIVKFYKDKTSCIIEEKELALDIEATVSFNIKNQTFFIVDYMATDYDLMVGYDFSDHIIEIETIIKAIAFTILNDFIKFDAAESVCAG